MGKGSATRSRILDVAQEAVLAKGFDATSIDALTIDAAPSIDAPTAPPCVVCTVWQAVVMVPASSTGRAIFRMDCMR